MGRSQWGRQQWAHAGRPPGDRTQTQPPGHVAVSHSTTPGTENTCAQVFSVSLIFITGLHHGRNLYTAEKTLPLRCKGFHRDRKLLRCMSLMGHRKKETQYWWAYTRVVLYVMRTLGSKDGRYQGILYRKALMVTRTDKQPSKCNICPQKVRTYNWVAFILTE